MADQKKPEAKQPAAPDQYMLDTVGNVVPVPAAAVQNMARQGYTAASPEQIRDYELQQKYGSTGQQVKTAIEGGLRGVTFGASDVAETGLGIATPEDIKGRQEANPTTSNVSELGGAVAPMLIPGVGEAAGAARLAGEGAEAAEGAGALAKAARFAPSNLVSKAGQAVEHAVGAAAAGEAPATFARTVAQNALAKGIGSAVEGMFYAGGHEVSEAALGDPNQNAQSILAHVGLGGLFGAGLGGLLGAGEAALPTAVSRAQGAIKDLYGEGKDSLMRLYKSSAGEKLTGTSAETAEVLGNNEGKVEQLLQRFPDMEAPLAHASPEDATYILENQEKALTGGDRLKVATDMREGLQNVLDKVSAAQKHTYTKTAGAEMETLLKDVSPHVADEQVGNVADRMQEAIAQMRAEPSLYNDAAARSLELMREDLLKSAQAGMTPAESFARLNTLRGQISDITSFDTKMTGIVDRNTNKVLKGLRSGLRDVLHDEGIWGQQGARKAALDDATSEWLKVINDKKSDFRDLFLDGQGRVKTTKLNAWLNAGHTDKGKLGAEALADFLAAARKVTDEAGATFKNAPVGDFDHEALTDVINKQADMTQKAREASAITSEIKARISGGMGIPNSGPVGAITQHAPLAGKALGALGVGYGLLHPVAGAAMAAGKVIQTLSSVPRTVATLTAIERTAQKVANAIDSGAAALVKGSSRAGAIGRGALAAKFAEKSYDDQVKDYTKVTEKITQLAQNPEHLHDTLAASTADLYEHAPDHAGAINMQQAIIINHLASKIPRHQKAGLLSSNHRSTPEEMGRFYRHVDAAHNPLGIFKHAREGRLMPEHIETVKVVAPALWPKIQQATIASMPKDPSKVPYKARRAISMILEQPADGSFTGAGIRSMQAAYAAPAPAPKPGNAAGLAKLTVSNRLLTAQQATAQRGG